MMTPLEVIFSEQADDDVATIYQWIARETASLETALGFVSRIVDRCEAIGNAPHGGTARDDLAPGLRTVPFERSALIAYRVEDDRFAITNVFYRGRDVDAAFSDED
jgi:toxin ParE1/3/4